MEHTEYQRKIVPVYGDKVAKEKNAIPAYERTLRTREVTFTCAICKKTVTQERFPGRPPKYCGDECQNEGNRAKTRERVRKSRQRKQDQQRNDVTN